MNELSFLRNAASAAGRLWAVLLGLCVYAALTAGLYRALSAPSAQPANAVQLMSTQQPPSRNVQARDGQFLVDGSPFFVNAVGWDPARPGELPWERTVDLDLVESDFSRMKAAGFNCVRTWAPMSAEELKLAEKHGLRVLQGIWVPPDGDFQSAHFRRKTLTDVARAVESSRWSPMILGYLVLNEPRAAAVARAGLGETRAFVRELAATVRAVDPSALVGFASWPGLEPLDDEGLDFVAFNLYPHRPQVVMDELGLGGYAKMLRESIARGRPLIISEYGVSVSPERPEKDVKRGGATEREQAAELVTLARTFVGAGAVGTTVFQWNDGWWKNAEGPADAQSHDPQDAEEWFGLIAFSGLDDRVGGQRPSLKALSQRNRAVLVEPLNGRVADRTVSVKVFSRELMRLFASVDGEPAVELALHEEGAGWLRGGLVLPSEPGRHAVRFELLDAAGAQVQTEERLLSTLPARLTSLAVSAQAVAVELGRFEVRVKATGGQAKTTVTIAAFTEDRYNEERHRIVLDARGMGRVQLTAPKGPTLLTILAFEDDPRLPPSERTAAWASVRVDPR